MLELDIELQRRDFTLQVVTTLSAKVTGIFGPSGSGKSSLLNVIAGSVKPTRGKAVLDGTLLLNTANHYFLPPHQRHIGLVFQDALLFPHLSVKNNLLYGYKNLTQQEQHFELADVAALLEIDNLLQRRPHQLSGGEKQRVALGRAILYSPKLLLLDEPLASLDDKLKQQILPFLLRIRDQLDIPMLYVSHSLSELEYLTANILYLDAGLVV